MAVHPDENAPIRASNGGTSAGVYLRWSDVTYDVPDLGAKEKGATKRILHGSFGSVEPGEMLAIMGPSGCGKSSLINILAQRRRGEASVGGTVEINGKPIDPLQFSRMVGYVTQDFVFFEHLTVRETLTVSALLRLPRAWTRQKKLERAEQLLQDLDLTKAADTMIGSPVATGANAGAGGISGGERRRLCMAMELMNNAPLLFLDEPTSGLDAASALMVVNVLKKLAEQGKTIVCVIHQPRASILPLFSRVLLLGAGQCVYYGPSCNFDADSDPMRDFFASAGYKCPPFENPADFILDTINTSDSTVTATDTSDDSRNVVVDKLAKSYSVATLPKDMRMYFSAGEGKPVPVLDGVDLGNRYATSWCTQFAVLFARTVKIKFRDPMSFWTVIGGVISVALLMGSIYFNLDPGDVRNRIAGIAMYISFMSFMTFDILMLWPGERAVYLRDQVSGMYCTSAFYVARSCAELPTHTLAGILGAIVTYYMYGLSTNTENVILFCALSVMTVLSASSLMMFIGAIAKNFEQSNQLVIPLLLPCMFFSGFFINEDMVPAMWSWVPDVNFLYYSTNYAVVREIQHIEGGCLDAAALLVVPSCDGVNNTSVELDEMTACDDVLKANGFDPDMPFSSVIMCHVWTNLLFRLAGYIGLRFCWTGQTFKQRLQM